jgi:hypothetical protein
VVPTTSAVRLLSRRTPVPVAARTRYEYVFKANVLQRRRLDRVKETGKVELTILEKAPQRTGYRDSTADPIAREPGSRVEPEIDELVGAEEHLEGAVVAQIWSWSHLDKAILKAIWSECDPTGSGILDRESFVKGMWRLDQELRSTRSLRPSRSSSLSTFVSLGAGQSPTKATTRCRRPGATARSEELCTTR